MEIFGTEFLCLFFFQLLICAVAFVLLVCFVALVGSWLLTFQDSPLVSSARAANNPYFLDCLLFEGGTKYWCMQHNIPEEKRAQLQCDRSLKSHNLYCD
jgi:hypothetical protein